MALCLRPTLGLGSTSACPRSSIGLWSSPQLGNFDANCTGSATLCSPLLDSAIEKASLLTCSPKVPCPLSSAAQDRVILSSAHLPCFRSDLHSPLRYRLKCLRHFRKPWNWKRLRCTSQKVSPIENQSHQGHQNCPVIPIQVLCLPSRKAWVSKSSKILFAMLPHPANHPAEKHHQTNTFHLCLGVLFLALLSKPPLSSMIRGSSLGFPNFTATFPMSVVDLLTVVG